MYVTVPERRSRPISAEQYAALHAAPGFWKLEESGYVSLRAKSGGGVLTGHKYVGRAVAGDVELEVVEKASGTLAALVSAATGAEVRIERADSPATAFDVVSRKLVDEFVGAAGRYIADRRVPSYAYRDSHGPTLGGTLDLARTIELHAAGFTESFAYVEGRVVRDEPIDRLVLAALDEVDRAGSSLGLGRQTLYDARWLAGALHEVRDERYLVTSRDHHLAVAETIETDRATPGGDVDLARLAAVTLLHQGFGPTAPRTGDNVPRAWFLDLETLFEQAVREALRRLLAPGLELDRGDTYDRRLFFGGSDASKTNPDVVAHRRGIVHAVGDVKYKTLRAGMSGVEEDDPVPAKRKKEGRPDLYQVLVHAAALGTDRAFLVYVSDDVFHCRYLGRAATGCRTWTAQVRPKHLSSDLTALVSEVGLA